MSWPALSLHRRRCPSRNRRACSSGSWNFASGPRTNNAGCNKNTRRLPSLRFRLALVLGAFLLVVARLAAAQLSIEITGAGAQRIPVAIVPFPGEEKLPGGGLTPIVRADLERSGLFRAVEVPPLSPAPTEASPINYAEWRARLADATLLGSVTPRPDGRFEARFRLYDTVKQAPLGGIAYTLTRDQLRITA